MRRVLTHSVLALLVLGGTMGAAPGHTTTTVLASPVFPPPIAAAPTVVEPVTVPYQVGNASWYGDMFNGKATASGEEYDMFDFTAAHRALPLGSFVKVTNLKNKKSVVVRINDRGPVTPGRIIDLSYKAAHLLGMKEKGVQKVRIDVMEAAPAQLAMARQPRNE